MSGVVHVTVVGAHGVRFGSQKDRPAPFVRWSAKCGPRKHGGVWVLACGATLMAHGTCPHWNEPLADIAVPSFFLSDAVSAASGHPVAGMEQPLLLLALDVCNHTPRAEKPLGSVTVRSNILVPWRFRFAFIFIVLMSCMRACVCVLFLFRACTVLCCAVLHHARRQIDLLRVAGRLPPNTVKQFAYPLDTGGALQLRVMFQDFPTELHAKVGAPAVRGHVWQPRRDQLGRRYFHCGATNETKWVVPPSAKLGRDPEEDLPGDWQERTDKRGRVYYFSPSTSVSTWTRPTVESTLDATPGTRKSTIAEAARASHRRRSAQ